MSLFKLKYFTPEYLSRVPTTLNSALTSDWANESNELYMFMCCESFVCISAVDFG